MAVVAVILLNAGFAFVQEMQAEHTVEALAAFLPATATVVRDGERGKIPARELVPGDVLIVSEGDRICVDARILDSVVHLDMSALTGESLPATRSAESAAATGPLPEATDLAFSGTSCASGEATVLVARTGMKTELGRIAILSQPGAAEPSPLERQVRRATMIIAVVAVGVGALFLPAGLAAGLGWTASISFAIGLIVANVPEGLLPTITLALAVGMPGLAHKGAVVKRLSAVETLGSTTVICTDKTGTLTGNRMRVTQIWLPGAEFETTDTAGMTADRRVRLLAASAALCTTAEAPTGAQPAGIGDPTELALLVFASARGFTIDPSTRKGNRRGIFPFESHAQMMTTIGAESDGVAVHTKGAPEAVLPHCTHQLQTGESVEPLDEGSRAALQTTLDRYTAKGIRVLAIARRPLNSGQPVPTDRKEAESGLTQIGLVAMVDPPRDGLADAVEQAHRAGIRIHVVTGDYGLTAAELARQVGIGTHGRQIVSGAELDGLGDAELDNILSGTGEIVFARTSPETKLRICEALQGQGEVVAMTGDGVNDAPALRHADIGVAMGRSGTDVARKAATMVLTDDNFATIVGAVDAGRRVFDNVRKFVMYIFAHAVPEVVPFLVFALSGGSVPLPLTVLQILAIDLGTEPLPALALGREPAEPGLMSRPPRPSTTGVIDRALLIRAWGLLGLLSSILVMGGYFYTLWRAGWHPGDPTGAGTALNHAYLQATTVTFVGIVACQIGTAFAARTDHASLFSIGVFSNPMLLWGIAFELVFTGALLYVPVLQHIFGTAALSPGQLVIVLPFPVVVWGADELVRLIRRGRARSG